MDLKKFRKKYKLSNADILRVVSYRYPKFCKYAMFMASNPKEYGVQLTPGAEDALMASVNRKKDNRKKNHQLTVRVDDNVFDILKDICDQRVMTVQDWIEEAIIQEIKRW